VSWISALIWLQVIRNAHRHYIFPVEIATLLFLLFEIYREMIILYYHATSDANALRVLLYGVEHVLLGVVLREALFYVEKYHKARKRSRRVR
jgi:hypothetical protein